MQALKLDMVGRVDSEEKEYYFTRPNIPALVDLSKCVVFVHTWENEDGSFGAELVFKTYRRQPKSAARKGDNNFIKRTA